MSKASEELEQKTERDVPTADEVSLEAGICGDPLRSVAIAAGVRLLAALVARRL
jgi:hypothetical protein